MENVRPLPDSKSLPYALYRAGQVAAFDRTAIEDYGIPGSVLMERAGTAAFNCLHRRWPDAHHVTVLTGVGNNGGDGFVIARLAMNAGLDVSVLQLGDREKLSGDAALNADRYARLGGAWQPFTALPKKTDVIVDAIFGTGLQREVSGQWAAAIELANQHPAPVLAVDIPSGLHSDTGNRMGVAIKAETTVTFIGLKQGMFTGYGPECCGEVLFDGLEVPARIYASQLLSSRRIDWNKQKKRLSPRSRIAHKGHFGHLLVIGGNLGFGGAAIMAAEAALRVGSGLVSLATRPEHVASVLAARPEIMVHGVSRAEQLEPLLRQCTQVAIGPGLGQDDWAHALWQQALAAGRPMVVDADGLNLLAQHPDRRSDWVLTPHPGEAARLLDLCAVEIMNDRFAVVEQVQSRFGGVAVLKGAGSLVASEDNQPTAVCTDGNPGMAVGGMGDVLTGVIGGLMAQGFGVRDAAEMGVCLHAAAADRVAAGHGERGLLASDLMLPLRDLVNPC